VNSNSLVRQEQLLRRRASSRATATSGKSGIVNINGSIGAMTQNSFRAKSTYFGAYAEDAFDATKDFTIVVGGRWDYTGRRGDGG
jgi:iron complex outermembrane receptor protein